MANAVYKLLQKIVLLLFPFLVFLVATEIRLSNTPTSYSIKRSALESRLDKIDLLILGSSQPLQAIRPSLLDCRAYNLANVSQTLYYDFALTSRYLDRMAQLKIVVIPISYFSLNEELKESDPNREYFYYHYWGIEAEHLPLFDIKKTSLIPVYSVLTSIKLAYSSLGAQEVIDQDGWKSVEGNDLGEMTPEKAKARIALHEIGNAENRKNNLRRLEDFILELKKRKIQPVFITTPVYKTYYENVSIERYLQEVKDVSDLGKKYHVPYYDYFKNDTFGPNDFSDNDHLNASGAVKFTRMLNRALNEYQEACKR